MASAARDLPADPSKVEPLWRIRLGTHQYTIPTIDRGRIYVGVDDVGYDRPGVKPTGGGLLKCLDQATGKLIWQMYSPRYFEGMIEPYHFDQWKAGFCSGPVVEGDRVYAIGNRGEILCLDLEGQANGNQGPFAGELEYMGLRTGEAALLETDGDVIWKFNMVTGLDVIPHDVCGSTLLLNGDLLYACTSNGIDGKHRTVAHPLAPSLIVLDKRTGSLLAVDGERIGERMYHGHWSSPCAGQVGGRTLVFFGGGDGVLYAFETPQAPETPQAAEAAQTPRAPQAVQTLVKAWSHDCNPAEYRSRDGRQIPYARDNDATGDGPSEIIGSPVFWEGRVYVTIGQSPIHRAGKGQLSCVDAATGKEVWVSRLVDRSLATPSIHEGLLYVVDYSGNVHCFDAVTGTRHWVHGLGSGVWAASTFAADGKVYVGTEDNSLWVLRAGKEKQVLAEVDLDSMPATLTAADGVLYVPTQKTLTAYPGSALSRPK